VIAHRRRAVPSTNASLEPFDKTQQPGGPACLCKVNPEPTVIDIRDADTLAADDEVITRVR
jgi:hypothetical protein